MNKNNYLLKKQSHTKAQGISLEEKILQPQTQETEHTLDRKRKRRKGPDMELRRKVENNKS